MSTARSGAWPAHEAAAPLDLSVEGPEARGVTDADIRRLFPGRSAGDRLNRLRNWPRLVVRIDDVPVGVATFTQTPIEMQIPDFAVDIPPALDLDHGHVRPQIISALLEAIEIAALAAGCRRIVIIPSGGPADFSRRGYLSVSEGCGGSWMEKCLL
ncbi:MAG: hypothetical protein JF632_00315 [Acidobacteria bacterium]|nr:hypothetical protein [Acidobacteriota bacterium]